MIKDFLDEEQWRMEAFGAVLGNDRWTCVTAGIAADGSQLFALYDRRLTRTRRTITFARDRFRSLGERITEIHRRLGIAMTKTDGVKQT